VTRKFFEYRHEDDETSIGVVALVDFTLYRYVPNFDRWIKDKALLTDLAFTRGIDKSWEWTEVSADQAAALTGTVRWGDPQLVKWALDEYEAEPDKLTSSDLGLVISMDVHRILAEDGVLEAV